MGISSSLFYSIDSSNKQTLHRRIRPTEEQFEEQQARWNLLADYLITDLKKMSGYTIKTWLQGSYKFGTQIRPSHKTGEFDIFMLPKGEKISGHTSSRNAAVQIIQGEADFQLGQDWHRVKSGDWFFMEAGLPHAINAATDLVFFLTLFGE